MFPQVPFAPSAHDLQAGQLATPQHTPSTQVPVAHSVVAAQVWPLAFLQLPALSHELVPLQVLGSALSAPAGRLPQVPLAPAAHDWHAGHPLAAPQQTPSTQLPFAQMPLFAHGCPRFDLQTPAPSHALVPVHVTVAAVSG